MAHSHMLIEKSRVVQTKHKEKLGHTHAHAHTHSYFLINDSCKYEFFMLLI